MSLPTTIKVGSEWNTCPCCHCSYLKNSGHHPACPVGISEALCHFCGTAYGHPHSEGCPKSTGLFPVLHRELDYGLQCADCDHLFTAGECFMTGSAGIVCISCRWAEDE